VLVADSRDGAAAQRLARAAADGTGRCHYILGCSADCPKGLDPAGAIRLLRRPAGFANVTWSSCRAR
jgi:succinate dehydrogenase / fumarate reductase iron-sulfur subunit/fumarate reductase iron-sulfur subunit